MEDKKKFKITLIIMATVVCCLLTFGIVQTFVLKSKQSTLDSTKANTLQLEQEYNDKKSTYEYMSDDENDDEYSDEYYNDYWRSQGYGQDGDKNIGTGE